MMLLEVAVTAPVRQSYTYQTDRDNSTTADAESFVGKRVLVPFGTRPVTGYVIATGKAEDGEYTIKSILKFLDDVPLFLFAYM